MIAFDIVTDKGEPDAAATKRVIQAALEDGLVLLSCGIHGNTIRVLNPLTIADAVLLEGLEKLALALAAAK
jgi:4-aminobutyrate aminotransferase/(S)-3-amino-2-methylpropionate transaminase